MGILLTFENIFRTNGKFDTFLFLRRNRSFNEYFITYITSENTDSAHKIFIKHQEKQ